ncbi:hypothetical protein SAMN05444920_11916 [Nonomuraea solani]|uniref:Uncharacterized protein n=1 Tax=Nonomuraea solani TaxID=1144553 RepID=A0A1H6EVM2_9ACTN|nr:hypothetical protein SAMN05444920_11916 [Nonomuraea solani]
MPGPLTITSWGAPRACETPARPRGFATGGTLASERPWTWTSPGTTESSRLVPYARTGRSKVAWKYT